MTDLGKKQRQGLSHCVHVYNGGVLRITLYLIIFGTGFLVGGVFPSYSAQYKLRLYTQFEQITTDLKPFREIADRYHDGSMKELIAHHLASSDPTFHDEGIAISTMINNQEELAAATSALDASYYDQAAYLLSDFDQDLAKTTWRQYTPAFLTTRDALSFATLSGLTLCAFFYFGSVMLRRLFTHN
jgi:hypothetical protein